MLIHKEQTNLWIKLPTIPPRLAGKIVKIRPLSEPIRLQHLEDSARSQAYKNYYISIIIHSKYFAVSDWLKSSANSLYASSIPSIQFKVDRLQIILVAKKYISTCRNCSSVGCLKCVRAIPQLVWYIWLKTRLIYDFIGLVTRLLIGQENIDQPRFQARSSKLFFHGWTKQMLYGYPKTKWLNFWLKLNWRNERIRKTTCWMAVIYFLRSICKKKNISLSPKTVSRNRPKLWRNSTRR